MEIQIKALAKINLFLHVLGKKENGYHALDSLVAFASDLYDAITIKESAKDKITQSPSSRYRVMGDNILENTLRALRERKKFPHLEIEVQKNIPIGGGLGGGSSDSAAVINYINTQYELKLSPQELLALATTLGADVPVCLKQKASYFTGIGEIVEQVITWPKLYAALVCPDKQIITKNAFSMGFNAYKTLAPRNIGFADTAQLLNMLSTQENMLLENALLIAPDLSNILERINQTKDCILSRMSGSGSTCFGLFKNKVDATNAAHCLESLFPYYSIYTTELI